MFDDERYSASITGYMAEEMWNASALLGWVIASFEWDMAQRKVKIGRIPFSGILLYQDLIKIPGIFTEPFAYTLEDLAECMCTVRPRTLSKLLNVLEHHGFVIIGGKPGARTLLLQMPDAAVEANKRRNESFRADNEEEFYEPYAYGKTVQEAVHLLNTRKVEASPD